MNELKSNQGFRSVCQRLRNKEMYYEEPGREEDDYASGAYWCLKTQEPFGPDGQPAGKKECCADRGCFVG